jgi:c-di-GMP-binding flagellar brake protein YcgR
MAMEVKYFNFPNGQPNFNISDIPEHYFNAMEKAITIDISGGGLKLIARKSCEKNTTIVIKMYVPDEITVFCKVIRCDKGDTKNSFKIGAKYINMDERVRDKIIKFIFEKVREQKKILR